MVDITWDTNVHLLGANPEKDRPAGFDELGRQIYQMPTGKKYYLDQVEPPPSLPETAKAAYEAIPPMEDWRLPTGEEFWGAAKGAAKAVGEGLWDVVESPTNPDATLGNAMDAASMGFTGVFTRVGKELNPSILSAGGAAPRYKKKTSSTDVSTPTRPQPSEAVGRTTLEDIDIEQSLENLDFEDPDQGELSILGQIGGVDDGTREVTLQEIAEIDLGITTPEDIIINRNLTPNQNNLAYIQQVAEIARQRSDYQRFLRDYQAVLDENWLDGDNVSIYDQTPFDPYKGLTRFQSPLQDVLDGWEFPKNGITGAQFLKGLQDNPTIRNSDIKSWGLELDPQKRYTKDELLEVIQPKQYNVFVENQDVFGAYQRQTDLKDPEVDYTELIVRGEREGETFTANSQHYSPDTLAHARVSERKGPDGNYLLIEEMQSDLLQQGYQRFSKTENMTAASNEVNQLFSDFVVSLEGPDRTYNESLATIWSLSYRDILQKGGVEDTSRLKGMIEAFVVDLRMHTNVISRLKSRGIRTDYDDLVSHYTDMARTLIEGELLNGNTTPNYSNILMDMLEIEWGEMTNAPGSYDFLENLRKIVSNPPEAKPAPAPPIAKTEESVRLAIEAAIAEADKRGLTQVVIPPFDKIVEKRFWQPEDVAKAKDPKSGFYQTYVKSLKKVLDGLQSEYSDGITISSRPLDYRGAALKTREWSEWAENTFAPALENRLGRYRPPRAALNDTSNDFMDYVISVRDPDLPNQSPSENTIHVMNTIQEDLGIDLAPWVTSVNNAVEDAFANNNPVGAPSLEEFLRDALSDKKGGAATLEGTVIDFSGLVNEGYDLSKPKFAEGGVVEQNNMDPVSGNPVPPGALPQEVRDDVDAKVSEGEYIIPANVVRFLGLDKLEKMVAQAEQKLLEMDQTGRIGGEKEGDLPFRKEELKQVEDAPQGTPPPAAMGQAPVKMAEGGVVPGYKLPSVDEGINPLTGLPWWMTESTATDETPAPATSTTGQAAAAVESDGGREGDWNQEDPTGLSAGVDTWSPKDFVAFANSQGSPEQGVGKAVTSMIPGGALLYAGRQRYLQRDVPEKLSQMISTGQDLQGNPLSEEQMADLMAAEESLMNTPQRKGILGGFLGKREPMVTELTEPFQQTGGAEVARAAGVYKEATPTEVETPTSRNRSTSVVPTRGKYNYSTDFNRTPGMPNDPRETGGTFGRAAAGGPGADPLNRMSGVLRDHRRSQEANRDLLDRATDAQTKRDAIENRRNPTGMGGGDGGRENAAERAARETSRNQARDALDNFERNTRNVDRTDPQTRENARDIKDRLEDRARGVTSRGFKKGGLVTKRKC